MPGPHPPLLLLTPRGELKAAEDANPQGGARSRWAAPVAAARWPQVCLLHRESASRLSQVSTTSRGQGRVEVQWC